MDTIKREIAHNFSPHLIIYKDGGVERFSGNEIIPPSSDPKYNVLSKDVIYSESENLSSRLYIPTSISPNEKLPLLLYFHGGGFCLNTPSSPIYHNYLNTLVPEAKIIAISVNYRRAPEHTIPIPYDDSWGALKWAASHVDGDGPEEWLNYHADFDKVFFAGDSAGGNIAHHMAMRYGQQKLLLHGVSVVGTILLHPYFWGKERLGSEINESEIMVKCIDAMWHVVCPETSGCDDPLINPINDRKLASLGGAKVLVVVAGNDLLRDRGWLYYETMKKNGWGGVIEIMEAKEEVHTFHLVSPTSENAVAMLAKIVSFIHEDS